jgi:hypothetical protein
MPCSVGPLTPAPGAGAVVDSTSTYVPPGAAQMLFGLAGVVAVLLIMQYVAPQYTDLYIAIVILGILLANAPAFAQFAADVQTVMKGE